MSNPSAKPFGSADRSTHASQWEAERSSAHQRGEGEPARSPYAPKRSRGNAAAESAGHDVPPPRFLVSSRHRADEDQDPPDFAESPSRFGDNRAQEDDSLEVGGRYGAAADQHGEEPDEIDLLRLEESVRRLQREAATNRARSYDERLAPPNDPEEETTGRSVETYIDGFRVPASLQPEILTPPSELRAGRGRQWTLLSMLVASAVAAPVTYYFATNGSTPAPDTRLASVDSRSRPVPSVEPQTTATTTIPVRSQRFQPPGAEKKEAGTSRPREAAAPVTVVPKRAPSSPGQASETPPPAARVEQSMPPLVMRKLDPAEIEVLIKQGQEFVEAGDFVTARLVFQRAAEGGSAGAALSLGATYDPVVLQRLGVRGVEADVNKARIWYERAKEFGAPDADRRINTLANR